jgi:hypothetical protein
MTLTCGIVGLPNVGKSTLLNCLSSARAEAANYPFCTIESNVGTVPVPDARLNKIAELVKPEKIVPTTIEFVDIAGLVKGASKGEGLGNQFLANIRETDAIIHVLRCFEDENVAHLDVTIDPVRDLEIVDAELQLKDLETIANKFQKADRLVKSGEKDAERMTDVLRKLETHMSQGKSARDLELNREEKVLVEGIHLLTAKPVVYVCNVDEQSAVQGNHYVERVKDALSGETEEVIVIAASLEAEIADLETEEERQMFLDELDIHESGLNKLIHSAYHVLQLETFFSFGEKEVRAWTVRSGTSAPKAGGLVHSDFERGFIKAEVIKYPDFIEKG